MYFPSSENKFLASVLTGLKKRHKALKHKTSAIACDKVIERLGDTSREKLEVSLRSIAAEGKLHLRAFVWEDRWVWIDCRSPSKRGWRWEWTHEGRLLPIHDGRKLVDALEGALDLAYSVDADAASELSATWRTLLAQGPKPVG